MIYSGKQIRVELVTGSTEAFLGSAWTLHVDTRGASVYNTRTQHEQFFQANSVVKVTEDHYSAMEL